MKMVSKQKNKTDKQGESSHICSQLRQEKENDYRRTSLRQP